MTAVESEELVRAETGEVLRWRFEVLVRGGFDPGDAHALASTPEVDLHRALELLARGCPGPTALRILL